MSILDQLKPKETVPRTKVTIMFEPAVVEAIRAEAQKHGCSVNKVYEVAVKFFLSRDRKSGPAGRAGEERPPWED